MKRTSMIASSAILLGAFFVSGSVFAEDQAKQIAEPTTAKTPVTADLTTPQQTTPKPPSDPDDPSKTENKPVDGGVTGEDGNLGIAYYPKSFAFTGKLGTDTLNLTDSGSNPSGGNVTYNIGVKDNTRQNNQWTLTAQLHWNSGELPGSTITITNPDQGKVRLNTNNGVTDFSAGDLVTQSDVQGTDSKSKGTVGKGTYDYSLGSVGTLKLTIPNATNLEAKQYSGNVNWNLQISPDTSTPSAS